MQPQAKDKDKNATVVTVGRNRGNSLVFDDDLVSERHAQIVIRGDFYFVKDLNSTHGTWVNGKSVKTAQLKDGDVVSFGSDAFSFVFSLEEDEPSQSVDSSKAETEEKIDLARLAATKKIDWITRLSSSPPSNVIPFVHEPARDTRGPAGEIQKAPLPATQTDHQDGPTPAINENPEYLFEISGFRLMQITVLVLLLGIMLFLHSVLSHKDAYKAGYKYALKEFANPPRDLNRSMIKKFARPAAFQMEIKESDYDDFLTGMEDASYKTYVGRFHSPPRFNR